MKRFLKKISLFLFLPLIIIITIDIWLRSEESLYKKKYVDLIADKNKVEVLILGNSHANYAVDPTKFDKFYAFNLANVSQKIYFDKRLTLKAIDQGLNKLKYVFISIDYHSLFTSSQGVRNKWSYYGNGIKYKNDNYLLSEISPFLWGYSPKFAIGMIKNKIENTLKYPNSPSLKYNIEKGINPKDSIIQGFISFEKRNISTFNENWYRKKAQEFNEPKNSERDEIIQDLTEFIEILIENKITPILFASPTYTEYNKYLDYTIISKNESNISEICKQYNVEYWNHINDNRFEIDDFYNGDHLNKKGAAKFSKILSDRLNKL